MSATKREKQGNAAVLTAAIERCVGSLHGLGPHYNEIAQKTDAKMTSGDRLFLGAMQSLVRLGEAWEQMGRKLP